MKKTECVKVAVRCRPLSRTEVFNYQLFKVSRLKTTGKKQLTSILEEEKSSLPIRRMMEMNQKGYLHLILSLILPLNKNKFTLILHSQSWKMLQMGTFISFLNINYISCLVIMEPSSPTDRLEQEKRTRWKENQNHHMKEVLSQEHSSMSSELLKELLTFNSW